MADNISEHIQKKLYVYRSDGTTYVDVTKYVAGVWNDNHGDVSGWGEQGQDGIAKTASFRLVNSHEVNFNPKQFYFQKKYHRQEITGDGTTKDFVLNQLYVYQGSCTVWAYDKRYYRWTDYVGIAWNATTNTWISETDNGNTIQFNPACSVSTDFDTGISTATFATAPPNGVSLMIQYTYFDNTIENSVNWFGGVQDPLLSSNRKVKFIVRRGTSTYKQQVITGDGGNSYAITATTGDRIISRVTAFTGDSTFLSDFTNEITVDVSTDEFVFGRSLAIGEEVTVQYSYNDGTDKTTFVGLLGAERQYDATGITMLCQDYSKILQNANIIFDENGNKISKVMPENIRVYGSAITTVIEGGSSNGAANSTITVASADMTGVLANGDEVTVSKGDVSVTGTISSLGATSFVIDDLVATDTGYTITYTSTAETRKYAGWLIKSDCTVATSSNKTVITSAGFAFGTYFSAGEYVMIDDNINLVGEVESSVTGTLTLEFDTGLSGTFDIYKVFKSGVPIETLIQNTIDDRLGSGVFTVTLASQGGGNLLVNYTEMYNEWWDNKSCFSFGWFLIGQHGHFFGFRYVDEGTPNQLQVLKLDRTKTSADRTMTFKTDFYSQTMNDSDNGYRDGVLLYYYNIANDAVEQVISPVGTALTAFDALMVVTQNSTAGINTEAEAQSLADNLYTDVSDTFGQQTQLDMPFDEQAELFELIEYEYFYLYPAKEKFATDSISNDYIRNRTTKAASNRIKGSIKKAQLMENRPGLEQQINDQKLTSVSKIPAPKNLNVVGGVVNIERLGQIVTLTIDVEWVRPAGFYPSSYWLEIKKSTDSWNTSKVQKYKTEETKLKVPIEDGTTYDIRVTAENKNNGTGIYSSEVEFISGNIAENANGSKVYYIRNQEQMNEWLDTVVSSTYVSINYSEVWIYEGEYEIGTSTSTLSNPIKISSSSLVIKGIGNVVLDFDVGIRLIFQLQLDYFYLDNITFDMIDIPTVDGSNLVDVFEVTSSPTARTGIKSITNCKCIGTDYPFCFIGINGAESIIIDNNIFENCDKLTRRLNADKLKITNNIIEITTDTTITPYIFMELDIGTIENGILSNNKITNGCIEANAIDNFEISSNVFIFDTDITGTVYKLINPSSSVDNFTFSNNKINYNVATITTLFHILEQNSISSSVQINNNQIKGNTLNSYEIVRFLASDNENINNLSSVSGATVTGSGSTFLTDYLIGDMVLLYENAGSSSILTRKIIDITSETSLTLDFALDSTRASNVDRIANYDRELTMENNSKTYFTRY